MSYILVDMDGTLCDWGKRFDELVDLHAPDSNIPRSANQLDFDLSLGLTEEEKLTLQIIMDTSHFYQDLEPLTGAIEALYEMEAAGHVVTVCSSPWLTNPQCIPDKIAWLENYV
jgi:5'-nucleotidase